MKHLHDAIHYKVGVCFNAVYCTDCKFTFSVIVPVPIEGSTIPTVVAVDVGADYCPRCGKEIDCR